MSSINPHKADATTSFNQSKLQERWMLFPFSTESFIAAMREEETDAGPKYFLRCGWCHNATIVSVIKRMKVGELEQVSIFMTSDASTEVAAELSCALAPQAKTKRFRFVAAVIPHAMESWAAFGDDAKRSNKFSANDFSPLTAH